MTTLRDLGFANVAVVQRFDCFAGTSKESITRKFGVVGVNVSATR